MTAQSVYKYLLFAAASALALTALMGALDPTPTDEERTPAGRGVELISAAPEPSVSGATGPDSELPSSGAYREAYSSLSAMASESEFIGLVTPLEVVKQVYPAVNGRQEFVWTLFRVRIDETLKGALTLGSEIVAVVVGGTLADKPVPATGPASRVPEPGDRVVQQTFADYPPYVVGRQEVAFLGSYVHPQFGERWWGGYAEGRFIVGRDGSLRGTSGSFEGLNGARLEVEKLKAAQLKEALK